MFLGTEIKLVLRTFSRVTAKNLQKATLNPSANRNFQISFELSSGDSAAENQRVAELFTRAFVRNHPLHS
jgi:hypothetical protein